MGRLPYGAPTKHVIKSNGGDTDIMKFYCTQNTTTYGQKFANFKPRIGRHTGTGYQSNFRPGVYYSAHLDELDNPVMGAIVAKNYKSVTIRDYVPYDTPTGKETLPNTTHQVGSGFTRAKPLTVPTEDEVRRVAIDTRTASAPVDIQPRYKPRLHKIQAKDPVESENCGYGPGYMTTETTQKFQGQQPDRSSLNRKSVCGSEDTGFTHAYNIEPITFHPDYAHRNEAPGFMTCRPTGVSIAKTHFLPSKYPNGAEPLPKIADPSCHDTGFTSGTKCKPEFAARQPGDAYDKAGNMPAAKLDWTRKNDPCEHLNQKNPDNKSSVTKLQFRGQQRPTPTEADLLGHTSVGWKEETGFTENNDRFVQTDDNPARFITHYMTRFLDRTPVGVEREGNTWGGTHPPQPDGFTKSTKQHSMGPDFDETAQLRGMEPYVGRSIRARDPFFDDHTYDRKMHTQQVTKSGSMLQESSMSRSHTLPVY